MDLKNLQNYTAYNEHKYDFKKLQKYNAYNQTWTKIHEDINFIIIYELYNCITRA